MTRMQKKVKITDEPGRLDVDDPGQPDVDDPGRLVAFFYRRALKGRAGTQHRRAGTTGRRRAGTTGPRPGRQNGIIHIGAIFPKY